MLANRQSLWQPAPPVIRKSPISGRLKYREEFDHGIENVPRASIGMLKGQNTDKQLVKISDPLDVRSP